MLQLPPLPTWDALHPLIVHFPIALLLITPVFILIGAILPPAKGRSYLVAAMILLLAGTAAIFVAIETGEAAGRLTERTAGVDRVLETHESLAERTSLAFSVLSVLFVGLVAVPRWLKRTDTRLTTTALPLLFLVLYGVGTLSLVNTAHNGGRLVHEFGVRALVGSPPENVTGVVPVETEQEKD